jgi:hypothetical protein
VYLGRYSSQPSLASKLLVMLNAILRHESRWNPDVIGIPSELPSLFSATLGASARSTNANICVALA